ncbi:MAG: hypothetical protein OHK0046_49650 [Anaerolineae bacterium]
MTTNQVATSMRKPSVLFIVFMVLFLSAIWSVLAQDSRNSAADFMLQPPILTLSAPAPTLTPAPTRTPANPSDCALQTQIPAVECEVLLSVAISLPELSFDTFSPCTTTWVECENGHVVRLYLGAPYLPFPGPLETTLEWAVPPQIGNLSFLETLSLRYIGLTSLPPEIGSLTALETLSLEGNQFTSLPPEIGSLTSLIYLNVSSNRLTTLPPEIGSLKALESISAINNAITTLPNDISGLTALRYLDLTANALRTLPSSISQLTALETLSLQQNRLTSLPPDIGQLSNLAWLSLSNNYLTTLPATLSNLTALDVLAAANNRLTLLPEQLNQLNQLRQLSVGYNRLTRFPASLTGMQSLEVVYAHNNRLTHLPEDIGGLTQLREITLTDNQLTTLPASFSQLDLASGSLDLSNNHLTSLPPDIGQMDMISTLIVRNNRLTSLPPDIGQMDSLETLDVSHNQLTHLPESLSGARWLRAVFAPFNRLTSLPVSFDAAPALEWLEVSNNALTHLSPGLAQLDSFGYPRLQTLSVANNALTSFPLELSIIPYIDLSGNQLTTLSTDFAYITYQAGLDVRYNQLTITDAALVNKLDTINPGWQATQGIREITFLQPSPGISIFGRAGYVPYPSWQAVDAAEWYHVYIAYADGAVLLNQWYPAADICSGGVCTIPDAIWAARNSAIQWWVGYWRSDFDSDDVLRTYQASSYSVNFYPNIPFQSFSSLVGLTPTGSTSGDNVTFQWYPERSSLWYQMWVGPADYSTTTYLNWINSYESCDDDLCTVVLPELASGDYEYWLQSWNPGMLTDWMKITDFTVTP